MPVGDVLRSSTSAPIQVAHANRMGPRTAMAKALAAYLEKVWWYVDGDESVQDTRFRLNPIAEEWPSADEELDYPTASIVEAGETEQHPSGFVPTPLEETWGTFDELAGLSGVPGKTVLWKEADAVASFQVDFWTNSKPDRQAIEAQIASVFSPGQDRYGVLVEGPKLYYSRPCRFTLETHKNDDTKVTAFVNERRLRCSVTGECDIVSLRMATMTTVQPACVEVTDPNDPPPED